ncbi:hypothetical protein [Clostridium sp. BJN0013]|uniref:hypothetical protein n=1 Tax=Clostridium sp. BJN0013 TaxID=3236840 RepID=UPI0034C5B9E1
MSQKVGIITLFNHNYNCGVMLQAFVLEKSIESLGYECKVINYQSKTSNSSVAPKTKIQKVKGKLSNTF